MTPLALLHECVVNRLDSLFGIGFVHTRDDVDLGRTLVDNAHVHLAFGESRKELCRNTNLVRHAVTDSSDKSDARENLDTVRTHLLRDVFKDNVLHGVKSLGIHDNAHGVNCARAEFVGESFAFKHGEHAAAKANFLVHHGLFDVDHREALTACNTRNRELCAFRSRANDGAGVFRAVRVADVDRNLLGAARSDGFIVEHACTGVSKFADFAIAHVFNRERAFDDARVSHEHARNVGPVFVLGSVNAVCKDSAGDVRTATAESFDFATEVRAIEARQYVQLIFVAESLCNFFVSLRSDAVLVIESDERVAIDEVCTEILCHEACAEEFATAHEEVRAHGFRMILELVFETVEVFGKLVFKTEVLADFIIALADEVPRRGEIEALGGEIIGAVEEVGQFGFFRVTLARSRNDDDFAVLVAFDNGLDFLELTCIGDRRAAELTNDSRHFVPLGHQTSQLRAQPLSSRLSCPSLPIWPATWFCAMLSSGNLPPRGTYIEKCKDYGKAFELSPLFTNRRLLTIIFNKNLQDKTAKKACLYSRGSMKKHEQLMLIAAQSNIPVLLQGESGVGKELAAKFIHNNSPRSKGPFIALNCGAIVKTLAESLLEGAKKGSYTGAAIDHQGIVQAANGGTLFLDEIGEMPFDMQSKLLRILQERSVLPLGATQSEPVDFRLVCATNRDLQIEINDGNFRKDLYFRLNAFPIVIPPLRDRDDFADIVKNVWSDISERTFAECIPLRDKQIEMLSKYKWPGNIRQLKNVLQRYALLKQHDITLGEVLAEEFSRTSLNDREFVNDYPTQRASAPNWSFIQKALFENRGNKSKAAKSLNISRGCLCYQIKKHEFQNNWDPCEKLQKYSLA